MSMSSSGATVVLADRFRIGNVLGRTMGVLSRHVVLFVLVAAVAQLPNLLLALFNPAIRPRPGGSQLITAGVVGWLVIMVIIPITQTVLYHAAFQDMLGRPIRVGDSLALELRRFFPILGAVICMGVLIILGFMLLVVPGIILATALAITIPVCVVEQIGPFASIRRSAFLTKGNRWRILGIWLLVAVVTLVASGLALLFKHALGMDAGAILGFVMQSVVSAFTTLAAVVMYHDLRVAKEGVDTNRIAAVFD